MLLGGSKLAQNIVRWRSATIQSGQALGYHRELSKTTDGIGRTRSSTWFPQLIFTTVIKGRRQRFTDPSIQFFESFKIDEDVPVGVIQDENRPAQAFVMTFHARFASSLLLIFISFMFIGLPWMGRSLIFEPDNPVARHHRKEQLQNDKSSAPDEVFEQLLDRVDEKIPIKKYIPWAKSLGVLFIVLILVGVFKEHIKQLMPGYNYAKDHNNTTDLMQAASHGDLSEVTRLINAGEEITAEDILGRQALTFAIKNNHVAVAQYLLQKGATVTTTFSDSFLEAVVIGSDELCQLMIENGYPVDIEYPEIGLYPGDLAISNKLVKTAHAIHARAGKFKAPVAFIQVLDGFLPQANSSLKFKKISLQEWVDLNKSL